MADVSGRTGTAIAPFGPDMIVNQVARDYVKVAALALGLISTLSAKSATLDEIASIMPGFASSELV